jgi:hypothetical protein
MSKYDVFIVVEDRGRRERIMEDAVVRAFRNFSPVPNYVKGGDFRDPAGVGFIIEDAASDFDAADKAAALFDRAKEHLADNDLKAARWHKTTVKARP